MNGYCFNMNHEYWLGTFQKDFITNYFHCNFFEKRRVIKLGKKSHDPLRWENSVSAVMDYGMDD
jgi:hypothetical protein